MSKFYNGIFSLILIFASFNFISCDEKNKPEPVLPVQQVQKPEEPVEKTQPAEIPPIEQTITPKTEEKPSENDAEYLRSINNLTDTESVSKEEFSEDKKEILRIISELSEIMEKQDISEWLNYIEPTSKEYYSNPLNLKKAQKKLPNKSIQLKNLNDYFKYIFIPSRKRSKVDEIRYISKTNIKAVEVKDDESIIVYYYFTKVNGKWLVHLPQI